MPLESATYISDLDPSNPVGSVDLVSSLDDHMRLVKATLQTTFPGITGAVTATHTELNHLDGVMGTTGTGRLVLDDAPTIADLTVTDSITLPEASIADAALSPNVPLKDATNTFSTQEPIVGSHSTETRIRRNNTTGLLRLLGGASNSQASGAGLVLYGTEHAESPGLIQLFAGTGGTVDIRGAGAILLNQVDVTDYARKSQPNTFTAAQTISAATPFWRLEETDQGTDGKNWLGVSSGGSLSIRPYTDALAAGTGGLTMARSGATVTGAVLAATAIQLDGATRAATIANSTSTTLVAGQVHAVTGNATLPNMAAGQWVGVINNSASPITVTKNASDTMYWTASGSSVASVTVAARGKATFFCADGTNVYASGNITGSS